MFSVINRLNNQLNNRSKHDTTQMIDSLNDEGVRMLNYLAEKYRKGWKEVNLLLVDKAEMEEFCSRYHPEKKVTDILTFEDSNHKVSGDLVICLEQVWNNAGQYELSKSYLLFETILHGFLHLYGLQHDYQPKNLEKVYQIQNEILEELGLANNEFALKEYLL